MFRTLSNIYNGAFCSKPCVNQAYLEPYQIQNLENIRNPVNHLWCSIFSEPFVTQAYLEPWYIQNLGNTQKSVRHLWCSVFFRTLCKRDLFRTIGFSAPWDTLKQIYKINILFRTLCNYSIFKLLIHGKP